MPQHNTCAHNSIILCCMVSGCKRACSGGRHGIEVYILLIFPREIGCVIFQREWWNRCQWWLHDGANPPCIACA